VESLGGEQSPVWFGWLVHQIKDAPRLFRVQPDKRCLFEQFKRFLMGRLRDELIQGGALEFSRSLDGFAGAHGHPRHQASSAFSDSRHGANMAPTPNMSSHLKTQQVGKIGGSEKSASLRDLTSNGRHGQT
jgi:hypothetical protein